MCDRPTRPAFEPTAFSYHMTCISISSINIFRDVQLLQLMIRHEHNKHHLTDANANQASIIYIEQAAKRNSLIELLSALIITSDSNDGLSV